MNNASSKPGSEPELIDIMKRCVNAYDTESPIEFRMPNFSGNRPVMREQPMRSYPGAGRVDPELQDQAPLEPLNLCESDSPRAHISLKF